VKLRNLCALSMFLISVSSCSEPNIYSDSGTFIDRGALSADRYAINFGYSIDTVEQSFAVKKAPNEIFVFNLRFNPKAAPQCVLNLERTAFSITVTDDNGKKLVRRSESLSRWTKSTGAGDDIAFFYLRDPNGTYAKLERNVAYSIRLHATGVERMERCFEFIAQGGGWK
jgi:hypothetical protein